MINVTKKNNDDAAALYERENSLIEKILHLDDPSSLSREELQQEFQQLGQEYDRLLKKIIKLTRIGDAIQRKLFQANNEIEAQKKELTIAYHKLDLISRTDPLTKLSNRRDILEKFENEISRFERNQKHFSIAISDIDNFKSFNDKYGHDCGDFVLVKIAEIMRAAVRKVDIVGRWGGEEFIIILPETPMAGGYIVFENIRKKIAETPHHFKNHHLHLTMTFGLNEFTGNDDIDKCIKTADECLYAGKQSGKNRVVLPPSTRCSNSSG